jgi:dienelactone hydrolase
VDLGTTAKSRNRYWGFTPKEMPLNGRAWYPAGEGPFPLVLIVHGNHNMKDFSDPGYEYLGELLASRGYIFASIDENFINGNTRNENDARGWFLLKHVEQFARFNEEDGNPFRGKVDLTRVALIGHSRGGEAVGHAAAFNRLARYPDDAKLKFEFGFGLRAIIAIAPVDGQYRPQDRLVPVKDVNYLVFHGSHDGDVSSFMGLRQYQRVRYTRPDSGFKTAVYVYRANHGQWNSVWGAHDSGPRSARILDLRGLLPATDQRRFAEVYISAFLDASLKGDARYLPLFRDHRAAADWLPKTMYFTRLQHASFRPLATFEDDIDVASGEPGVRIRGDSLAVWKESGLNLRTSSEGATMNNWALTVGWNNRIAGEDTTRTGPAAVLELALSDSLAAALALTERHSLDFLLMPTADLPGPRADPDTAKAAADSAKKKAKPTPKPKRKDGEEEKPPVDLSVALVDADGNTASLPLSRYGAVRRPLQMSILRRSDREKTAYPRRFELVLQSYSLPLWDFRASAPQLDLTRIRKVRFVFDRAVAGTVLLDDVGFSLLPAGFWKYCGCGGTGCGE